MQQAEQAGSIVVRFFIAHDGSNPVQLSWMDAEQKQYGDMIISGNCSLFSFRSASPKMAHATSERHADPF